MIDNDPSKVADRPAKSNQATSPTSPSLPVSVLTVLGSVIVVLGLFAAGDLAVVVVGLSAVAVAGLLHVLESRK